ncbi:MAG: hypothetical protein ACRDQA_31485, partial [Nocardioidaceae bacterium]
WCALAAGFASAGWILLDTYARGHRQPMRVMEAVWPITGLYFGPVAVWGYRRFGRPMTARWQRHHQHDAPPEKPPWAGVAVDVSHCGAGCTLGDIIAEFTVFGCGFRRNGARRPEVSEHRFRKFWCSAEPWGRSVSDDATAESPPLEWLMLHSVSRSLGDRLSLRFVTSRSWLGW